MNTKNRNGDTLSLGFFTHWYRYCSKRLHGVLCHFLSRLMSLDLSDPGLSDHIYLDGDGGFNVSSKDVGWFGESMC